MKIRRLRGCPKPHPGPVIINVDANGDVKPPYSCIDSVLNGGALFHCAKNCVLIFPEGCPFEGEQDGHLPLKSPLHPRKLKNGVKARKYGFHVASKKKEPDTEPFDVTISSRHPAAPGPQN